MLPNDPRREQVEFELNELKIHNAAAMASLGVTPDLRVKFLEEAKKEERIQELSIPGPLQKFSELLSKEQSLSAEIARLPPNDLRRY